MIEKQAISILVLGKPVNEGEIESEMKTCNTLDVSPLIENLFFGHVAPLRPYTCTIGAAPQVMYDATVRKGKTKQMRNLTFDQHKSNTVPG